jgi:hypothetical protein
MALINQKGVSKRCVQQNAEAEVNLAIQLQQKCALSLTSVIKPITYLAR